MSGVGKTVYHMRCRTCGKDFQTTHPRVNCDACGKLRQAGAAAQELAERLQQGQVLTSGLIKATAERYGCSDSGLKGALKRLGIVPHHYWSWQTVDLGLPKKAGDQDV